MSKNIPKKNSGGQCSAIGCTMRRRKSPNVNMFYFPRDPFRCEQWGKAIKRKDWKPTRNSLLCSFHFITGRPSSDPDHPDYIPTLFSYDEKIVKGSRKKLLRDHDNMTFEEFSFSSTFYSNYDCDGIPFVRNDGTLSEKEEDDAYSGGDDDNDRKHTPVLLWNEKSFWNILNGLQIVNVENCEEEKEKSVAKKSKPQVVNNNVVNEDYKDPETNSDHEAGGSNSVVECSTEIQCNTEETSLNRKQKKRKLDNSITISSPVSVPVPMSMPKIVVENLPVESSCDREDIFGEYVASEMKTLRENPLLYLQTKQSILQILTSANFELINPE